MVYKKLKLSRIRRIEVQAGQLHGAAFRRAHGCPRHARMGRRESHEFHVARLIRHIQPEPGDAAGCSVQSSLASGM
jgi:hypothetical protein